MKLVRFATSEMRDASPRYGALEGEVVRELAGAIFAEPQFTGRTFALSEVRLLAPSLPSKIVCVGRNYREHAQELGNPLPKEPLLFLKPPSSVIGPEEAIVSPTLSHRVDYEGELGVVIARRCRRLAEGEDVRPYVLGYTCLNDVTARDLQKQDVQFTRSKGFDTFCPLGPLIATDLDPGDLRIETYVNGERRQQARTSEMIFSIDAIIRFISNVMTLLPGDVIATGTPAGVGPLQPGDTVEIVIEGIGRLSNPVLREG